MKESKPTCFEFEKMEFEPAGDKISIRMVSGNQTSILNCHFEKGCLIPEHSHENEQVSYILQGCLKGNVNGQVYTLKVGQAILIPSLLPHQWEAIEDTYTLEIFSPPREKPSFK